MGYTPLLSVSLLPHILALLLSSYPVCARCLPASFLRSPAVSWTALTVNKYTKNKIHWKMKYKRKSGWFLSDVQSRPIDVVFESRGIDSERYSFYFPSECPQRYRHSGVWILQNINTAPVQDENTLGLTSHTVIKFRTYSTKTLNCLWFLFSPSSHSLLCLFL